MSNIESTLETVNYMKQEQKVYEAPLATVIECDVKSCILADSNIDQGTLGGEDGDE